MTFHHIKNENGIEDSHWYIDLNISKTKTVRNMLIDTGASITTLSIKSLARIYGQSERNIIQYLNSSKICDERLKYTATNDGVKLVGVYLRNVTMGDVVFPVLKVYTRLDGYVRNLVGMDILSACDTVLYYGERAEARIDMDKYNPDIVGAVEIVTLN